MQIPVLSPASLLIIYMGKQSHIAIQWVEVGHIEMKSVLDHGLLRLP